MTRLTLATQTLRRAVAVCGGRAELAAALRTSPGRLETWLTGEVVPPAETFLKAVDLIISEQNAPAHEAPEVRLLHRAMAAAGGRAALAEQLKAAPEELDRWLKGEAPPPGEAFLRALDLLVPPAT